MLRLDSAPFGVPEDRWILADAASQAQIGELWLISWDGEALALGVISRRSAGFVACWPVTFADAPVFAPALVIEDSPLGVPVLVWPTRETGLGMHMLHRRFGQVISRTTMAVVDRAMDDDGGEFPLALAAPTVEGEAAEQASDEMLDLWESICLNTWPTAVRGRTPFRASALQAAGMQASEIAAALAVPLPAAASLIRGELIPTADQVETLALALGVDPESILESGEDGQAQVLLAPEFKEGFLQLARSRAISEAEARDLVRAEFALAARSAGDTSARARSVIERLLQSG